MRQYAWYSPDLNVIVLQTILGGCNIAFEWDWMDIAEIVRGRRGCDAMEFGVWIPLGEL